MNGISHAAIGGVTGFVVASVIGADLTNTGILAMVGGITALVPDLDTSGRLANKITIQHGFIRSILTFVGLLIIAYSWLTGVDIKKWLGILIGISVIVIGQKITKKIMLILTGVILGFAGVLLSKLWVILAAVYLIIASFLPHRSYTHSLIGLLFFSYIAYLFSKEVNINGIYITSVLGYSSHLVADMKIIPSNKRGIKLLRPIINKEF